MTLLPRVVISVVLPAFCAAVLVVPGGARAQAQGQGQGPTVYRCGAGNYSSEPCPGGVKIDTPAPPTAEQQRLAREAAARDAKLAQQLADERKARERAAAPQAANVGPSRATNPGADTPTKATKSKKDKRERKADSKAKAAKAAKARKAKSAH